MFLFSEGVPLSLCVCLCVESIIFIKHAKPCVAVVCAENVIRLGETTSQVIQVAVRRYWGGKKREKKPHRAHVVQWLCYTELSIK